VKGNPSMLLRGEQSSWAIFGFRRKARAAKKIDHCFVAAVSLS
jgi:hypothetical protein